MRTILLLLLAYLAAILMTTVSGAVVANPDQYRETLSPTRVAAIDSMLTAQNFSGVSAVRKGGPGQSNLLYHKAFGYTDWQWGKEMKTDSQFPVASNTKLFVAVSLYQLQEQGKVNLSHNVADYLDAQDFSNFGVPSMTKYCPTLANSDVCQNQTFVQLMSMSGGISNEGLQFLPYPGSLGAVFGRYIKNKLLFVPGTQYYYSNPSFMFCAYFIEKFSGLSFENYLKKNIFDPVGLKDTKYDQYDEMFQLNDRRISEFHRYIDPTTKASVGVGKCTSELNLGSANGAGGIVSTQDDIALWYFKLFNFTGHPGAGILSAASMYEIVKPRTYMGGVEYYAQGLFVNSNDPTKDLPQQIIYEGMIQCSWTANYYDLTEAPLYWMTQVWSNTPVFYIDDDSFQAAKSSQYGSWWTLTQKWPQALSLTTQAINIRNLFS